MNIDSGIDYLVNRAGFLSSLTAAYGNESDFELKQTGVASELVSLNGTFVENKRTLNRETLYDLASITKLFTLISCLMLVESRQVKMTDVVSKLDPRFKHLSDVSIYDLLCYRTNIQSSSRIDRANSVDEAEKLVFSVFNSKKEPEKVYTDMNALVLKYVLEAVCKISFDEFLHNYIFKPLNMTKTNSKPLDFTDDIINYRYEYHYNHGEFNFDSSVEFGKPHDPKARLLMKDGRPCSGHAGLFSCIDDMVKLAQGILNFKLISRESTYMIANKTTGFLKPSGKYQQYMGMICFIKSSVERLTEVPFCMSDNSFALGGYTGNHIAIDLDKRVFDIMLGNRCHNRLSKIFNDKGKLISSLNEDFSGEIAMNDGRKIKSSYKYVYQKDRCFHFPVFERLNELGFLR